MKQNLLPVISKFIFDRKNNEYSVIGFGVRFPEILEFSKTSVGIVTNIPPVGNPKVYFKQHKHLKKFDIIFIENPLTYFNNNNLYRFIKNKVKFLRAGGAMILLSPAKEDGDPEDKICIALRHLRKQLISYDIVVKRKQLNTGEWLIKFIRTKISKAEDENADFSIPIFYFLPEISQYYKSIYLSPPASVLKNFQDKKTLIIFPQPGIISFTNNLNIDTVNLGFEKIQNQYRIKDPFSLIEIPREIDVVFIPPHVFGLFYNRTLLKKLFSRLNSVISKNCKIIFGIQKMPEHNNKRLIIDEGIYSQEFYLDKERKTAYYYLTYRTREKKLWQTYRFSYYSKDSLSSILENRKLKTLLIEETLKEDWYIVSK
ncbi:MAG: hypothetical protein PHV06_00540 [bacterium]|nr:hypothetical protein [bacterium]